MAGRSSWLENHCQRTSTAVFSTPGIEDAVPAGIHLVAEALTTAERVADLYHRAGTLADIAGHQARRGDWQGAQHTIAAIRALKGVPFPTARPALRARSDIIEDCLGTAFANLVREHLAVKDAAAALRAVRSIPREADRIFFLTEIAVLRAQQNRQNEAQELMEEACASGRACATRA
jgi:hypothetical protein